MDKEDKTGLTLVEMMIIVVILGIIASIVVPEFSKANSQSKESALLDALQAVRSQIELYKVQHNNQLPSECSAGFVGALTGKTNHNGEAGGSFGPYLERMPANPFCQEDSADKVNTNGRVGDGSHGWEFNTKTGEFKADDSTTHGSI